jgi:hypothetical protein
MIPDFQCATPLIGENFKRRMWPDLCRISQITSTQASRIM